MKNLLFAVMLLSGLHLAAAPLEYSEGGSGIGIDPAAGTFRLKIKDSSRTLESTGPLWSFRLFDAEARKRNTRPLHGEGVYYGIPWSEAPTLVSSKDARFLGSEYRDKRLTLRYSHPLADVELYFDLADSGVTVSGRLTNRGETPVCDFSAVPGIRFRIGEDETVIAPDPLFNGVEFSRVFSFSWGMCYAWDGFLIRDAGGRGFLAFDNAQDIERRILASGGAIWGDPSGKRLSYENNMRIFAKKGEPRESSRLVIRHFPDLRSWADECIRLNYPRGLRKLSGKMPEETFRRFRQAYLAPSWGTFADLGRFAANAPGTFIVHPPNLMRAPKGTSERWDAFPNYFPPHPGAGTREEYEAFVRRVVESGNLFMPRTSFFYWAEGTDFDQAQGLEKNAVRRIDGLPRTARWAQPGYLMSPSAKPVLAELDRVCETWKKMGANLYFTNVICALDPYNNRYDFHPDAPGPDLFYDRLFRLLKRYGEQLPLFSEGGGLWQLPYQVGFNGQPGWDREAPVSRVQDDPKRGIMKRAAFEIPLSLDHEYVQFFPHNTSYDDGPYSIPRLSWSLAHGMGLKCGFYAIGEPNSRNLLYLRTIALLAERLQPYLFGKRLMNYTEQNGVVTADYEGTRVLYNPTAANAACELGDYRAEIAPDGFGFRSADGTTLAGYFSEFAGTRFASPVLLVLVFEPERIRIFAPLEEEKLQMTIDGKPVEIPAYPAALAREVPGVALDRTSGKCAASPAQSGVPSRRVGGSDAQPEIPPYRGEIPLLLDWRAGEPLPEPLRKFLPQLSPEGLRFPRRKEDFLFEDKRLVFNTSFYLEALLRYNGEPTDPTRWGEISIIRPEPAGSRAYTRTIELRYHIYRDQLRFLLTDSNRRYFDLTDPVHMLRKGKFFHVIARWDGKVQSLTVNGKTITQPLSGTLSENQPVWKLGDTTTDLSIMLLRIGGTRR